MIVEDEDNREESMEYYGFGIKAMEKFKVCSGCWALSPASDRFCKECGSCLPAENLYSLYRKSHRCCTKCETIIADTALFCPQCGEKQPVITKIGATKVFCPDK